MRSRRLLGFVAVLVAVLVITGPPSTAQQPIRIGVSLSLTGETVLGAGRVTAARATCCARSM
jgi:hypothetical protein